MGANITTRVTQNSYFLQAVHMDVIEVLSTPNPNAMKFILERAAFPAAVSCFNPEAAGVAHPLAKSLFEIDGVKSILLLNDFVTVNKSAEAKWPALRKAILRTLKMYEG
jgi:hypothetical protein